MLLIDNISDFANQTVTLILEDSTSAELTLIFNATTERWMMNLVYGTIDFTAYGIGVCCHPNLLRQWKDILPFGLQVITPDQTDPFTIQDFSTGRAKMYILNESDVQSVEREIYS